MSTNLTAGYLVDLLKDLPHETPVFVRGFEDGVDYVTSLESIRVNLFAHDKWYDGQHSQDPNGAVEGVKLVGTRITNPSKEMSN